MSKSELYLGHGIVPSHPHHMDNFQRGQRGGSWYDTEEKDRLNGVRVITAFGSSRKGGGDGVQTTLIDETNAEVNHGKSRKRQRNFAMDESSLDDLADRHGYTKIYIPLRTAPLASYCRGVCRLNFWLTTGNVGFYLDHPTQGRTLLVRRGVDLNEAEAVFQNPTYQAGRGYR